MKRNYLMASMLAVAAIFTGCSEVDEFFTPNTSKTYEASVFASKDDITEVIENGSSLGTRAVFVGGNTDRFATLWDKNDVVQVYKDGNKIGTLSLNTSANAQYQGTKDAYLSGTLTVTGTVQAGDDVDLYLPSKERSYINQLGTINNLSANFSYQMQTVKVASVNGSKITLEKANMTHRQGYVLFTLKDQEGNRLHLSSLTVSATGDYKLVTAVSEDGSTVTTADENVITLASVNGEYPGEVYVSIPNQGYNPDTETYGLVNFALTAVDANGVVYVFPGPDEVLDPSGTNGQKPILSNGPTVGALTRSVRTMTKVEPTVELGTQMKMVVGTKRTRVPVVKAGETVVPATCTYSSSNYAVASVNAMTGEVMALSTGTATITVNIAPYNVSRTYTVNVIEPITEYVDLGLSVNWATMNVGAESATDYGTYFSWGEVDGYTNENDYCKKQFDWTTYKWCNGTANTLTKYVLEASASQYGYNGFYDNKSVLDPEDDAATQNWGAAWRTPTIAEMQELIDNCTWTWETSPVAGYRVTGSNNNSIFLPAAAFWYDLIHVDPNRYGYYMTSSILSEGVHYMWYLMYDHDANELEMRNYVRSRGYTVRAVCPKTNLTMASQMKVLQGTKKMRTPKVTVGSTDVTSKCSFTYASSNYGVARVSPTGEVTGVTPGTATITVTSSAPYAASITYTVTVTSPVPATADNYVNLGLPSGTKWAKMNVGANSETGYGTYFAWGETDGYTNENEYNKKQFDWATYKWCNGTNTTLTKYCNDASYGYNGYTDGLTSLESEDDAATQNWGSAWRTPTFTEMQELIDNCTWTWEASPVAGYRVTGSNNNSIFLPAAGFWYDLTYVDPNMYSGYGYYMTSWYLDAGVHYMWYLMYDHDANELEMRNYVRSRGYTVRAVVK